MAEQLKKSLNLNCDIEYVQELLSVSIDDKNLSVMMIYKDDKIFEAASMEFPRMFILRKAGFAMKFLIPEDEFGVFADQRGVPRVDSLFVAATFEKQHYNVLRDIGRITASNSGLSPEFIALNFEGNTYRDARGRRATWRRTARLCLSSPRRTLLTSCLRRSLPSMLTVTAATPE